MGLTDKLRRAYRRLPGVIRAQAQLAEIQNLRRVCNESLVRSLVRHDPRYSVQGSLARFEHQAFSQGGEDGIIREIFRRIGNDSRYFVEFGVEDGRQTNTHFLLHDGWKGCWLEANPQAIVSIRSGFPEALRDGRLQVEQSFVTAENIIRSFDSLAVPKNLDLLSIDIDGNDYWIWKALSDWHPRVVVIEYNALFPPDCDWVMPYDANHRWQQDSYFGSSLKALERLGRELGYRLVGCCLVGSNAFFVRADLAGASFCSDSSAEFHYEPARYFLAMRSGHNPSAKGTAISSPTLM
jgi:hypothetical protein